MSVVATPSVRKLAGAHGVDVEALAVRLGRKTIAREDVLAATDEQAPQPSATDYWDIDHAQYGAVTTEPLSRREQVAAANLAAAQARIPAVTHHDSADLTRIEATLARRKAQGGRITMLAFHVAALARCLQEYPRFNTSLSSDGKTLVVKRYVHVGLAVDTPLGLVVPVLRDADRKRIPEISDEIGDLAARARARRIRPDDLGGASMTISNLGAIGGEAFTPIVNPPEVAILGLSKATTRPFWNGETFLPRRVAPLDLSYDHRVLNGADAARFLARYCDLVQDPDLLLL